MSYDFVAFGDGITEYNGSYAYPLSPILKYVLWIYAPLEIESSNTIGAMPVLLLIFNIFRYLLKIYNYIFFNYSTWFNMFQHNLSYLNDKYQYVLLTNRKEHAHKQWWWHYIIIYLLSVCGKCWILLNSWILIRF